MKRFANLVLYEVGKSKGMLLLMAVVLAGGQLGYRVLELARLSSERISEGPMNELGYLLYTNSAFMLTMLAMFSLLFLHCIYLWAREWRGQGSFIYRLFMLPGSRMKFYFAKLASVFVMLLILQGVQFIVLALEVLLTTWWVPRLGETMTMSSVLASDIWQYLLPLRAPSYLWMMVLLLTMIVVWFQLVIIEEGLKSAGFVKMVIALVVYSAVTIGVAVAYVYLSYGLMFTAGELYLFTMLYAAVFFVLNVWLASYLLERRVSV